jgi:peptidoglycan hydrolase CwlO-like protein
MGKLKGEQMKISKRILAGVIGTVVSVLSLCASIGIGAVINENRANAIEPWYAPGYVNQLHSGDFAPRYEICGADGLMYAVITDYSQTGAPVNLRDTFPEMFTQTPDGFFIETDYVVVLGLGSKYAYGRDLSAENPGMIPNISVVIPESIHGLPVLAVTNWIAGHYYANLWDGDTLVVDENTQWGAGFGEGGGGNGDYTWSGDPTVYHFHASSNCFSYKRGIREIFFPNSLLLVQGSIGNDLPELERVIFADADPSIENYTEGWEWNDMSSGGAVFNGFKNHGPRGVGFFPLIRENYNYNQFFCYTRDDVPPTTHPSAENIFYFGSSVVMFQNGINFGIGNDTYGYTNFGKIYVGENVIAMPNIFNAQSNDFRTTYEIQFAQNGTAPLYLASFQNFPNVRELVFPSRLRWLGWSGFVNFHSLERVIFMDDPNENRPADLYVGDGVFGGNNSIAYLKLSNKTKCWTGYLNSSHAQFTINIRVAIPADMPISTDSNSGFITYAQVSSGMPNLIIYTENKRRDQVYFNQGNQDLEWSDPNRIIVPRRWIEFRDLNELGNEFNIENDLLKSRIVELSALLAQSLSHQISLQNQLNTNYEKLLNAEYSISTLLNLKDALDWQVATLLEANSNLQKLYDALLITKSGLDTQIIQKDAEILAKTNEIGTLTGEKSTLQSQLNTLNTVTIPALAAAIDLLESAHENALALLQAELNTANQTVGGLNSQITTKDAQIATLNTEKAEITASRDTWKSEYDALNLELIELQATISAGGMLTVPEVEAIRGELNGIITNLSADITIKNSQIATLTAEKSNLQTQLTNANKEIDRLNGEVEQLSKNNKKEPTLTDGWNPLIIGVIVGLSLFSLGMLSTVITFVRLRKI